MLLSSFFEDITADQYNMPSFGEGLNFSNAWLDLPPQFMGTATSFGQHPPSLDSASPSGPSGQHMSGHSPEYLRSHAMSHMMPPPPPPQHPSPSRQHHYQPQYHHQQHQGQHHLSQQTSHHSDDVLNAAATLLQNGQGAHHISQQAGDFGSSRRPMGPPVGHLRHQPLEDFQEDGRKSLLKSQTPEAIGADWMHPGPGRRQTGRSEVPTGFQFGSDSNFSSATAYTPDANRETVESMHREQLKLLEGLEVSKSAANTRPSSPSNAHRGHATDGRHQPAQPTPPAAPPIKEEDPEAPPRKRRKSKNARENPPSDEDDDRPQPKDKGKRKPKTDGQSTDADLSAESAIGGAAGKKRKPGANGVKAPRENLSEEQKRENHIKSEQKRRTLIKEGFDDLCELIPGLRSGGFSKSAMLSIAGDWLEELLDGNEALAKQLAEVKR
jgi:hypothetical protein